MSFLSPGLFLLLVPLVAVPLILHLLNRSFPRQFRFPSIELIKESVTHSSKLYKWRHWILLLLRTLFLALLLMAFLLPVLRRFGSGLNDHGIRHVLIMFDHSVSMENKGDGPTSRERAVHEATGLINSLESEDRVNILLMDPSPSTCFVEFSNNHADAKRFLQKVKPGFGHTDVNLANAAAVRTFSKTTTRPEVYYFSDFQRKNWGNVNFSSLPDAVKLFFIDVGAANRNNHAVLDARLSQAQILAGDTVNVEITVGNFSSEPFAGKVSVELDQQQTFDHEASVPPWSEGKLEIPLKVNGPGLHLCEVEIPADALPHDNRHCLTIPALQKEEVLIVADDTDNNKSGAYFLKTALNPFESEAGSLLPRIIGSGELSATRLAGVRKVFFTHINRLNEAACAATAQFLFKGGGLIYFLDGPADPENLSGLEKVTGSVPLPLRLSQRRTATNVARDAQQVVRGDFKSKYLKLFQGPARQNLALLEFYDYYQASATGTDGVLLHYGDESPAMGVFHHGLGTMLLLNFSAGEVSSNLARQRLFPVWMQELIKAIATEEAPPEAYMIGQTLNTELWRSEMRDLSFRDPAGSPVTVKRELSGDRYSVSFVPEHLGFYTLGESRPVLAFGVNTSPDEADLRAVEKEVFPTEFAPDRTAHFLFGSDDFDELAKGKPLFHWFILLAALFLLLETGFQFLLSRRVA